VTQPATAKGTIRRLYPRANARLPRMVRRAERAVWTMAATGARAVPWKVEQRVSL
jgi:hypothetical protein